MAPSPWLRKPTLVGTKATLRPFRADDVPRMKAAIEDPDVLRLTGSVHTTAEAEACEEDEERLRAWYTSREEQDERLDLAVVDNGTGLCVGEVVLNEVDAENESCNFRTLIGPDGRDRGLGTEAIRLLLDHAFHALPLHRVSLSVYAFNPRAQRVYENVGFVVEGRERDVLRFDGERIDSIVMSVLRPEWLAARTGDETDTAT